MPRTFFECVYECVCAYGCVNVWMGVWEYAILIVCDSKWLYLSMYVFEYVSVWTCVFAYMCVRVWVYVDMWECVSDLLYVVSVGRIHAFPSLFLKQTTNYFPVKKN